MKTTRILATSVLVWVATLPMGIARADFTFSTPIELGPPIWSPGHDPQGSCFSRDGLELYFSSTRPGGYGFFDIWVATRETVGAPWGEPVNLGPNVNTSAGECEPAISPDGLELYFGIYHESPYRIWMCSRPSKDAPWSNPELLPPPVGDYEAFAQEVSADGLSLYFSSGRPGGYGGRDIWVATRAATEEDWGTPVNLGPSVNSTSYDAYPSVSSDGLALFFTSDRPGGYGGRDIWVTTRPTTDAKWGTPVNYASLNRSESDWDPAISPDGSVLYFESIFNMWQASITPIVDFNGDGIVDSADMCVMVDQWGTDSSLYDIGPMPWGDGIVDVQDLIVLAEHLFTYPGAVAYWKLDETEGDIACDSIGVCDGALSGAPTWQPAAGMVDGALQFDGVDDYVSTEFVLSPAGGEFSVFAWIKGGTPGQAILSQADGSNWLCMDSVEGCLMTELKATGRGAAGPLLSQTVVADDTWHRIGLVWGGLYRYLYVDGVEVAKDATPLSGLESAEGGLYFGVGSTLAPGSFFSGLIDDIRIYKRAVHPQ